MDLLQKYKEQEGSESVSQKPPAAPSFDAGRVFSGLRGTFDTLRQSQMALVLMSGVMLTASLVLFFDVVSVVPPKIEPLPVGAFPTLDLRKAEEKPVNLFTLKNEEEGESGSKSRGASDGIRNQSYASGHIPFASQ